MARVQIQKALISVSNKAGVVDFAKFLTRHGVEILSTGGTLHVLRDAGIDAKQVSGYTGHPEIFDGRVKTLHPKIHGGILARRNNQSDVAQMKKHKIEPIDMVVVNLYPFEEITSLAECTLADAIENIDIGGPSLLRSAAKNSDFVTVVTDPADYDLIQKEMLERSGGIRPETRRLLAAKAFVRTAEYDRTISEFLLHKKTGTNGESSNGKLNVDLEEIGELRYGENPHQKASWYASPDRPDCSLPNATIHSGKALSYNNILDLEAAVRTVRDFPHPTVAIIKHNNPCGLATNERLAQAYQDAYDCDPVSAYGSIIGLNRKVDSETAAKIHETTFVEAVIAPGYEEGVLEQLTSKPNRRFLELSGMETHSGQGPTDLRWIEGGALVQEKDIVADEEYKCEVVTERAPTQEERESMLFAFRAAKHVKSNAIVLTQGTRTVGVGAGQMNRLESVKIAAGVAGEHAAGSTLASDAFFPFRDGIDAAAGAGIKCIIQPGGSKRDAEAIEAANEAGIAMVFTGIRHFRH